MLFKAWGNNLFDQWLTDVSQTQNTTARVCDTSQAAG